MNTELVPVSVPFQGGGSIACFQDTATGAHYIAFKPACEAMGLDFSAQLKRAKKQPWSAEGMAKIATPSAGGTQQSWVLSRTAFLKWMEETNPGRVKDQAVRQVIVRYQKEAATALDRHFFGAPPSPEPAKQLTWTPPEDVHFKPGVLKQLQAPDVPESARELAVGLARNPIQSPPTEAQMKRVIEANRKAEEKAKKAGTQPPKMEGVGQMMIGGQIYPYIL